MLLHIFHATKSSMQESFSIPLRSSHWCPCIDYLDIKNYSFQGLPLYNEPEAQLQFQCFMFWGATVMPVTTWGHTNTKINTTWAARHRWHGTWWWPLWKVAGFMPQALRAPSRNSVWFCQFHHFIVRTYAVRKVQWSVWQVFWYCIGMLVPKKIRKLLLTPCLVLGTLFCHFFWQILRQN